MEIQDAVKLIYQNEFAGGHIITDNAEESLTNLRNEYARVGGYDANVPRYLHIGNGLVRANLRAIKNDEELIRLNARFVATAKKNKGTHNSFFRKVDTFLSLCSDGTLPFEPDEAFSFIVCYRTYEYPMLLHSNVYRHAYRPAYRVVSAWSFPVRR